MYSIHLNAYSATRWKKKSMNDWKSHKTHEAIHCKSLCQHQQFRNQNAKTIIFRRRKMKMFQIYLKFRRNMRNIQLNMQNQVNSWHWCLQGNVNSWRWFSCVWMKLMVAALRWRGKLFFFLSNVNLSWSHRLFCRRRIQFCQIYCSKHFSVNKFLAAAHHRTLR